MEEKFNYLKKECGGLVTKITKKFVKKNEIFDFEDLLQEANIEMLNAYNRFDSTKGMKLSTYVGDSVKRRLIALKRKEKIQKEYEHDFSVYLRSKVNYISNNYIYKGIFENFKTEVERLSKKHQKVIQMKLDGKTYEEIGKELGVTKQAVSLMFPKIVEVIKERVDINI